MPSKESFFAEHYAYARQAGLSDVQARLAVSQAAVETGWGEKGVAVKGNNFHGMKVGDDWTGKSINLPTREETKKGKSYTVNANFRQYETPVDSYRDWAKKMERNWPGVMKAKTFDKAVEALNHGVKGVYATDNNYGSSLKAANRDLGKSGVITKSADGSPSRGLGANPFGARPGLAGDFSTLGAYSGTVPARTVQTSRVPTADAPPNRPFNAAGVLPGPSPMGGGLLDVADVRSITNAGVLDSLHPAFRDRAKAFFSEAQRRGINIAPVAQTGGYRSLAQQAAIGSTGVIAASPGGSFHNYGLGFDYAPIDAKNRAVWDKQDPRWAQARSLAEEFGMVQPIAGDLGHVQLANFSKRVPGSLKTAPTFEDGGFSYPSLDPTTQLDVAGGYGPYAHHYEESLAAAPLGQVERAPLADVQAPPDYAGLQGIQDKREYERPSFAAPLGRVDRAPLADVAPAGTQVASLEGPATDTRQNFPGMSVPADVASPRTMADLGGLGAYLAANPTESLPPDRQMPSEPVGLAAAAPDVAQGLGVSPARPDNLNYAGPKGLFSVAPNVMSPDLMSPSPALSPPTEVQDRPVTQTIAAPNAPTSTTIADPMGTYPDEPTPENTFPDAPPEPTRFDALKASMKPALKNAVLGGLIGGLPGAAVGLIGGLMSGQGLGLGSLGNPAYGPASAGERYSIGSGLGAMQAAMSGNRGATAYSRSNPGSFRTARGRGLGSDLTNQFGAVTGYDANGNMTGANRDTMSRWGDVLGGLFGGDSKKSDKDKDKGRGLGGGPVGGYSGNGLY